MASAIEPGTIKLFAIAPGGARIELASYRNGGEVSAGGSPDGVLANKTADTHLFQNIGGPVMSTGWKFMGTITLDSADGLDASDATISIPLTRDDGVVRYLNATDLVYTTDYPAGTIASVEIPIGSGYSIPNGERWKFGGGPIVIAIEDDT